MAQITSGIRAVLSHPRVYDALQSLMGARRFRQEFVGEFIRPTLGWKILDIGCGTAELLTFLPEGVEYVGYDPSEEYIAHARNRYGGRGEFHCGFFSIEKAERHPLFDVVLASGVLHHMDDTQLKEMMTLARDSLDQGGRLVTIDPVFCSPQNPVARLLISMDRGQNVRTAKEYTELASFVFPYVNGVVRHRAWIPYTHWIMECRK
jgi:SAM-dependent methyltransferase